MKKYSLTQPLMVGCGQKTRDYNNNYYCCCYFYAYLKRAKTYRMRIPPIVVDVPTQVSRVITGYGKSGGLLPDPHDYEGRFESRQKNGF